MGIPKNLNECYKHLDDVENIDSFIKLTENKAIGYSHFSLGMWIRNNWKLWSGGDLSKWFNNKGLKHPDDMSGVILLSYHRHKNSKNINLQEQIDHYIKFWIDSEKQDKIRLRKERTAKIKKIDGNK